MVVPLREAVAVNPKIDRTQMADDTSVSFVPMAAVGAANGSIDASTVRPYAEVKKGYTHFRENDVLFAKVTPCMENGKMAVARNLKNGIGFGSTEFHVLRPREGVDPHYVYHFISSQTFRKEAARHMTGAVGLRRVPTAFLESAEIPLPTLDVQREIVAELEKQFSRLDEAVANLQRVKANLKRYKASVLKAAVEGRLVETEATLARREGRTYETGEQLLQRIVGIEEIRTNASKSSKSSEQGDCPEGWARTSIGRISEFSFYGPRFSSDAYSDKGVFVLRTTDIDESGRVDTSTAPRIDLDAKDLAKYRVAPGDLLVTRTGSLGRVALFEDKVDAIPGAYLIQIRLRLDEHSRKFLLMFLQSPEGQARLTGGGAGVGRQNLNAPTIAAIAFGLPPRAEQARIVAEVDRHLSIIREVEAEVDANLQRAQALRQATLMKCFSY